MIDFNMDGVIQWNLAHKQEERLAKRSLQDNSAHFGYYFATMIGNCLRRGYWDKTKGNTLNMDALRRITLGNIIQGFGDECIMNSYDNIAEIERSFTIPIKTPNVLEDEYVYIIGRMDHLLTFTKKNNSRYYCPIEAKYLIDKLVKDLDEPKPHHLWQMAPYQLTMGKANGFLYYIDHHLKAKTFEIEFNHDIWEQAVARVISLHDWVKNETLPPAEAMYAKKEHYMKGDCYWCSYWRECQKEEKK